MKYRVGDKVKVRSDLKAYEIYGSNMLTKSMEKFAGKTVTISDVGITSYAIEEMGVAYWTDEMLEPVEEMSAEELTKILGNICKGRACSECPVHEIQANGACVIGIGKNFDEAVKIAEQWKEDHEKKPIETEYVWYVQIIEADTHLLKHEELLKTDFSIPMDRKKEEILKKYCSEHDGKYYAISERRCVVNE